MPGVEVGTIADWLERHPRLDQHVALFGTTDPEGIGQWLSAAAQVTLGTPAVRVLHYEWGQVPTACLELDNSQAIALKVFPDEYERPGVLVAARAAQTHWADRGHPVPSPLAGPARLGDAQVTVDEYRPGDRADARRPAVRREMAAGLAALIADHPPPSPLGGLRRSRLAGHPQRPIPVDTPAVLTSLFQKACEHLLDAEADLPVVVGHLDWRVQNIGWRNDTITAIYDWDSVAIATEPRVVGVAAGMFSYDFTAPTRVVPSPEEIANFVSDYRAARRTGDDLDVPAAHAAAVAKFAGYAIQENQADPDQQRLGPWSFRSALMERTADYLSLLR